MGINNKSDRQVALKATVTKSEPFGMASSQNNFVWVSRQMGKKEADKLAKESSMRAPISP